MRAFTACQEEEQAVRGELGLWGVMGLQEGGSGWSAGELLGLCGS